MSYIALANITLSSAQTSVTFGSIPTSVNGTALRDLVLVTVIEPTANGIAYAMSVNGDTSTNRSEVRMYGDGSGFASDTVGTSSTLWDLGYFVSNTNRMTTITQFMDYSATDKHKTFLHRWSQPAQYIGANAHRWHNTAAITSIQLSMPGAQFKSGCTFALYGIAG